jgi:hypothetical protein
MRLEIPHTFGREAVRSRIAARIGEAGSNPAMAGGQIALDLSWIDQDNLAVKASAMGYTVPATLTITDTALVFDVTIPPGMGFARGLIESMIRERGEKLLG